MDPITKNVMVPLRRSGINPIVGLCVDKYRIRICNIKCLVFNGLVNRIEGTIFNKRVETVLH